MRKKILVILILLILSTVQWSCASRSGNSGPKSQAQARESHSNPVQKGLKSIFRTIRKGDKNLTTRSRKSVECRKKCPSASDDSKASAKCVKKCLE